VAEPAQAPRSFGFVPDPTPEQLAARRRARFRAAVAVRARAVAARLTAPARLLPGVAAVGCAFAGSWLLWSLGVALLVVVPFLLLLDARTTRG
jgi:hypothetical protein